MAKAIYVQRGETIDFVNTGETTIGYNDIIDMGTRIGVAKEEIAVGATGAVAIIGVYECPAVANAAFAVGDVLYYDAEAEKLTKVSAGNTPAGTCIVAKATAGTTAVVLLDVNGLPVQATIADLAADADAAAIVVGVNAIIAALRSANVIAAE